MRFNYNTELADNPWLDRRVPYAFHLAMDRDAIIDFLFLGKGKPSAIQRLNWYHAWAIPDDEMRQLPGYKPVKDEDIAEARALLAAAGIESGSEFPINNPAEFEGAYPGSSELYANMFSQALDLDVKIVLEPYGAMYQQMVDGSFIGHMPVWLSSGTGDPTGGWSNELVFGAGGNLAPNSLANWDGFDAHRANLAHPFQVFNDSQGRLIEVYDNQGPIYGADISSLPEIPDAETYIFRFDQGARFWDRYPTEGGRLFTAADAAVNINRQIAAVDADGAPDARFARAALYQTTASVEVTDEPTLTLKTDGPDATYLETVHTGYSFMTSPEETCA